MANKNTIFIEIDHCAKCHESIPINVGGLSCQELKKVGKNLSYQDWNEWSGEIPNDCPILLRQQKKIQDA